MPRARMKPTLTVRLSPQARSDLKAHADRVRAEGEAARKRREAAEAAPAIKGASRRGPGPAPADPVARLRDRIARLEARAERLGQQGLYAQMDRARAEAEALGQRLTNAEAAAGHDRARAARQDRFRTLCDRSVILDDWHVAMADRWLAALDQAAGGLLQRGADPEKAAGAADDEGEAVRRDPITGRRLKPDLSGPAMFVSGPSVLDRWGKAVPASEVALGRRRVPPTFDPKRRNARGGPGAPSSLPDRAFERRGKAHRLTQAFGDALKAAGHPDWCEAVAIRVILSNETLTSAMKALGVAKREKNLQMAQTAMAAGLCGVARTLGLAVPE